MAPRPDASLLHRRRRAALLTVPALALTGLAVASGPPASAAPVFASGFSDALVAAVAQPTDVAPMPDGRLLVSSQRGQLRVIRDGALVSTPALDLSSRACTNSERGLLGVVADPDAATRAVYVYWTVRGSSSSCPTNTGSTPTASGSPVNRVSRFVFTAGTDRIDPATETVLIDGIPSPGGNHNAGDLGIGKDGMLYVAVGDGGCDYRGNSNCGGANDAARDRNTPLGKILRITRAGAVPSDNPWTGTGTARCNRGNAPSGTTCQEAFAIGLRNPFRIAFDPDASSTSFRINDVGQASWEEINQGVKGADYGWNIREGRCANTGSSSNCGPAKPAGLTDPIHVYAHSGGCESITGGAYVPDAAWPAPWNSRYLFADYVCGRIMALGTDGKVTDLATGLGTSSAVALAFGPTAAALPGTTGQSLYYTTYASGGQVRRITATGLGNRTPTALLAARPAGGAAPLTVTLDGTGSSDPDGDSLTYLWSFGDGSADATTTTPTTTHSYRTGTWTATLRVRDAKGATSAPVTARVVSGSGAPSVTISSPAAGEQFTTGAAYVLRATANDAEDGPLPSSALSWEVLRHHDTHTHPYLGPVTGNDIPLTGPEPEDLAAAADSWLEIRVTATDSDGLTTTVTREFRPRTAPVTIVTNPPGRRINVNGTTVTGPTTFTSWVGYRLNVTALPYTDASGRIYGFESWSDGGAESHTVTTPAMTTTLTATFTLRGLPGRYYPRPDLGGTPVDRLDPVVNGQWGTGGPPLAGIGPDSFSVRWAGQVRPATSETYRFTVVADDAARLWVGGRLIADGWSGTGPQTLTGAVPLTVGTDVPIGLEYREGTGTATARLRWSSPSRADEVVPTSRLLPRYAFSFQPGASPLPSGYLLDDGALTGTRAGVTYGWSADRRGVTRDRRVLGDPLFDAFVHLDGATWQLALPSGRYRVTAAAGDPSYTDSRHVLDAEGVRLLDGVPTSTSPFVTGAVNVSVTDGALTVRTGTGGSNVKLNLITVEML